MPVKKGDFLLLDFTCRVKESDEVIDTSIKEVAEKSALDKNQKTTYEPLFVVVGEEWVPKGLDEGLKDLKLGEEAKIEVPPEKGYGERDPSKMRLIPLRKFSKDGINPVPGMPVTIDKKTAFVRSVGAGRVQVDFNHPLAGKTLMYEITPNKVLGMEEDKIRALVHKHIPSVKQDGFQINIKEKNLSIEIPFEAFYIEGLQFIKRALSTEITKLLPNLENVMFIESFVRPKTVKTTAEVKPKKEKNP